MLIAVPALSVSKFFNIITLNPTRLVDIAIHKMASTSHVVVIVINNDLPSGM